MQCTRHIAGVPSNKKKKMPLHQLLLLLLPLVALYLCSLTLMSHINITQAPYHNNLSTEIRIQSWNLRYDSHPDSDSIQETIGNLNSTVPFDDEIDYFHHFEETPWSSRRLGVANEVLFNKADIFSVNEALARQVEDLADLLYPMEWIGVGRDDGVKAGEFQAIYYNPQTVRLLDHDTFWLSDTPFVPSKYPGAGSFRSATVGHFQSLVSKKEFTIINLHLDDQSDDQRQLSAAMAKVRGSYEYAKYSGRFPVFLVGDFNSQSSGDSSAAYQIATGKKVDYDITLLNEEFLAKYNNSFIHKFEYSDLLESTPVESRMGHHATFTGFEKTTEYYTRIDFQFGGRVEEQEDTWKVVRYRVGDSIYDNTHYLSDHRPVICDLQL